MTRPSAPRPWERRVVGLLLRVLPHELVEHHGSDIIDETLAELTAARSAGPGRWLSIWCAIVFDTLRVATREHWRRRHRPKPRRRSEPMHAFWSDLRFAWRTFSRQRGATALVLLTLTLAVAANTAVFTLVDSLFLRPLPYPAPDRLVYLNEIAPKWNLEFVGINYPDFVEWQRSTKSFEAMALTDAAYVNLSDGSGAERVQALVVTRDYARVLGIGPVAGRMFTEEEDRPNGPAVVVISHALWRDRFNGASDAVGQTLRLNSRAHTIVGVMPAVAAFRDQAQVWLPYAGDPAQTWQGYSGEGVARLKPGVTVADARADLLRAQEAVWRIRDTAHVVSPRVDGLRELMVRDYRTIGRSLSVAVLLVLLIACANVGGTMLARATLRQREFAVRMSLGASSGRVGRQLLTESLALSAGAGILGTVLGAWGIRALAASAGDRFPSWVHFQFDARSALYAIAIVVVTAMLFGLVPALQARRSGVQDSLASGGTRMSASAGQRRLLNGLVIVENTLATVLLAAGLLLVRAYYNVRDVNPGFSVENVATFRIALPEAKYPDRAARQAMYARLLPQLAALPGVQAAGAITCPPLSCHQGNFWEPENGALVAEDGSNPVVLTRTASPGYFDAMGIQLQQGRFFREGEGSGGSSRPAVVNASFAKRMWPGDPDVTGRRFRGSGDTSQTWFTIVGVTRDEMHYGLDRPSRPGFYAPASLPDGPNDMGSMAFLMRTAGDPSSVIAPARALVRAIDPELPMYEVGTMSESLSRSLAIRRMFAFALAAFAMVALTLAVGGIYAVLSYVVGRRRREIGIRVALGAQKREVLGMVVRQGGVLVAIGLGLGLPAAMAAARVLSNQLVGVRAGDPLTYAIVALVLGATGLVAALVPARRAAAVEPTETLADVT